MKLQEKYNEISKENCGGFGKEGKYLINVENNRFHMSDEKIELIKYRNLQALNSASPMLADFIYIGGKLYFFDFEEVQTVKNDDGRKNFVYNIRL